MSVVLALVAEVIHLGLMIVAAPLVAGASARIGGLLTGRSGAPLLQPCWDVLRLLRKTPLTAENASIVSRLAPPIALGAMMSAAAVVPSFTLGSALAPLADGLAVVALLTLARVALALAVLDTGPPAAGLAQQSDTARAILADLTLLLAIVAVGALAGSTNLDRIVAQQRDGALMPLSVSAVAFTAMLIVIRAEPPDDPPPMYGGTDRAMVLVAGWLRRLVWIDLAGAMFLPIGMGAASRPATWAIGLGVWLLKLALGVLLLAGLPPLLGRPARRQVQGMLTVAALMALMAVALAVTGAT